ncbi:hypothetical protein Tco_1229352 [Tanacetum coccineum]
MKTINGDERCATLAKIHDACETGDSLREELLEIAEDVFANIANGVLRVRVNHKYPLSQAPQAHLSVKVERPRAPLC